MATKLCLNQALLIEELRTPFSFFELFSRIEDEPYSFILDSTEGWSASRDLGRYSFCGIEPFLALKSSSDTISIIKEGKLTSKKGNPLDLMKELLERYSLYPCGCPVPFAGGAVGYIGYEIRHFIEKVPCKNTDNLLMPHLYFSFYDCILAHDHLKRKTYVISTGLPEETEKSRLKRAEERLKVIKERLGAEKPSSPVCLPCEHGPVRQDLKSNYTREEYLNAVQKVKEYIAAGDIFQANLSQRFKTQITMSPFTLYGRLRRVNPSPFSAYLAYPEGSIACSSPERFLKLTDDTVVTRPIKGTRPRGKSPEEDRQMAFALSCSPKDRAENIMIVDLERNDLGRVCQFGTIKVEQLAAVETFPTVFHLTSTVSGRLHPGKDIMDLIKAAFPGGSITGAPKVRAMEIIDELEPDQRGPYTGALGYLSFNGNADLNIIIRTFILKDNSAYFNVGGGIVYDSQPEIEYQETLDKAQGLLRALNLEGRGNL